MSFGAFQINGNKLYRLTSKKTLKLRIINSLWRWITDGQGIPPKVPVMWNGFPCYDVIMTKWCYHRFTGHIECLGWHAYRTISVELLTSQMITISIIMPPKLIGCQSAPTTAVSPVNCVMSWHQLPIDLANNVSDAWMINIVIRSKANGRTCHPCKVLFIYV